MMVVFDVAAGVDSRRVSIAEEYMASMDGSRPRSHKCQTLDPKRLLALASSSGGAGASDGGADASLAFDPDTSAVLGKEPARFIVEWVPRHDVHTRKCVRKRGTTTIREWTMPANGVAADYEPRPSAVGTDGGDNAWVFGEAFVTEDADGRPGSGMGGVYTWGEEEAPDAAPDDDYSEDATFVENDPLEPYDAMKSIPDIAEVRFYIVVSPVVKQLMPEYAQAMMHSMQRRKDVGGAAREILRSMISGGQAASVSSEGVFDNMMQRAMSMWSPEAVSDAIKSVVGFQNMVQPAGHGFMNPDNPLSMLFVNLDPARVVASTETRFNGLDANLRPSGLCCSVREYGMSVPTRDDTTLFGAVSVRFNNSVAHTLTGQNCTIRGLTRLLPMFKQTPDHHTLVLQFMSDRFGRSPKYSALSRVLYNTPLTKQVAVFDEWVRITHDAKTSRGDAMLRLDDIGGAPRPEETATRMSEWTDPIDAALGGVDEDGDDAPFGAHGGGQMGDYGLDDLEDDDGADGAPAPVCSSIVPRAPSGASAGAAAGGAADPNAVIAVVEGELLAPHHLVAVLGMNPPSATVMKQSHVPADSPAVADILTCDMDSTDRAAMAVASLQVSYGQQVQPQQRAIHELSGDGVTPRDPARKRELYDTMRSKGRFWRQLITSMYESLDRTLGAPNPVEVFTAQMKTTLREAKRRMAKDGTGASYDSLASRSVGGFMRAHADGGDTVGSRFFLMFMAEIGAQMGLVDHQDLMALVQTSAFATAGVCRLNYPAPNLIITGRPGVGKSNLIRQGQRTLCMTGIAPSASDQALVSGESYGSGVWFKDEFSVEDRGLTVKKGRGGMKAASNNTLEATWKQILEAGFCSRKVVNMHKGEPGRGRSVDLLNRRSQALYVEVGNLEASDFSDPLLDRYEIVYWVRQRRLDGRELSAEDVANDRTTDDMRFLQYMHAEIYRQGGLPTSVGAIDVPTAQFGGRVLASYQRWMDDELNDKARAIPLFNGWSPRTWRRLRTVASGIAQLRAVTLSKIMTSNGLVLPQKIPKEAYEGFLFNALNVVTEADAATAFMMYASVMVPSAAPIMMDSMTKAMMMQQHVADRSSWKTTYPWDVPETPLKVCTAISATSTRIMPDYVMLELNTSDGPMRTWQIAAAIQSASADRDGLETSTVDHILRKILSKKWAKDTAWLNDLTHPPGSEELHPVDARLRACDAFGFEIVGVDVLTYVAARNEWGGVLTPADTAAAQRAMAGAGRPAFAASGAGGERTVGGAFLARLQGGRAAPEAARPEADFSGLPRRVQIAIMREKLALQKQFQPRGSGLAAYTQTLTEKEEDDAGNVTTFKRVFLVVRKELVRMLRDPASVFVRVIRQCCTPFTKEQKIVVPVFMPGMPNVPRQIQMGPNPDGPVMDVTNKYVMRAEDAAIAMENPAPALGMATIERDMQRQVAEGTRNTRIVLEGPIDAHAYEFRMTAMGMAPNQVAAVHESGKVFTPRNMHELEEIVCAAAANGELEDLAAINPQEYPLGYMGSRETAAKIVAHAQARAPGCTGITGAAIASIMAVWAKGVADDDDAWGADDEREDLNRLPCMEDGYPSKPVGGPAGVPAVKKPPPAQLRHPEPDDYGCLGTPAEDDFADDEEAARDMEAGLVSVPTPPTTARAAPGAGGFLGTAKAAQKAASPPATPTPLAKASAGVAGDACFDGDVCFDGDDDGEGAGPGTKRGAGVHHAVADDMQAPPGRRRRLA